MLTEAAIKNAKPGRHADGRGIGLMLLVRDSGAKFWVQRLTANGKRREIGHGRWPDVGLAEARRAALAAFDAAAQGIDPVAARKGEQRRSIASGGTFGDAAAAYVEARQAAWRGKKTAAQFLDRLNKHASALMEMPPAAIDVDAVFNVLKPVWAAKPAMSKKLREHIEAVLEHTIATGQRPPGFNPAAWKGALRPLLPKVASVARNRHNPALEWQRVPAFMAALASMPLTSARCLGFVILTATRSGEARAAQWSEVDFDAALWRIPKTKTKSGRGHIVPLSPCAVALLRSMPQTSAFIFPSTTRKAQGGPLSDAALSALIKRIDAEQAGGWKDAEQQIIVPHGFRSSFRDWCGDNGHPRELAEAALSHQVGDATERAYARSALVERRRSLMNAWAEFIVKGAE